MREAALVLFDDRSARDWMPFALTRPLGELRFGAFTLRERAERVFGLPCIGHLAAKHLLGFDEPGAPPVLELASLPADRDLLFLSSRAVPAWGDPPLERTGHPAALEIGGECCGWYAPAGTGLPPAAFFLDPASSGGGEPEPLTGTDIGAADAAGAAVLRRQGLLLERPWQLIVQNGAQLTRDILALFPNQPRPELAPGVQLLGDAPLIVDQSATIEPGVLLDLRGGPIWIDAGAEVAAFTRLAGPAYIGRKTKILGGSLAEVSIGPVCRIHGEVESSVVLGYSNKAHDGFLGHAYLGCWVNLGAMTTNSDLKNNYGPVRVWTPAGEVDTGERKLGCLLGDHVKTAIGTLLNTGTVVGAGANLFGGKLPPHYVPPFSWGIGPDAGEYELERFLATAAIVMSRREVTLTTEQRALLEAAWRLGRGRS
jgi:UDP-N-acetylglucosamine diphosphorylase/glucosamine-1-phosphate N-acetyltransferase